MQVLLVLVHWTSGQPPRAPEHALLMKAKTENGPGSMRILEGLLYIIPPHLKTHGLIAHNRTIPRRPQPTTGALLVDYFAFLRPLYELAYEEMGLQIDKGAFYVYKGRRYKDEQVGRAIQEGFALYGRMIMQPSHFRQGVQTYFREHLVPFLKLAQERKLCDAAAVVLAEEFATTTDAAGGDISTRTHTMDAMADHSTNTAVRHYGVTKQDDAFLTPIMWRAIMEVTRAIHHLLRCDDGLYAQWEATAPGMASTCILSTSNASTALVTLPPAAPSHVDPDAIGRAVAGAFLGLLKGALPSDSITHAPTPPEDDRTLAEVALREMMGPGLSDGFRNEEQASTFLRMWKGEGNTLVVLPTGGGKSLLFCLLAKLTPHMYTIVVVPLATLLRDLEARARQYGVQVHNWSTFRGNEAAMSYRKQQGLVLIAAENLKDNDFKAFLCSRIDRVTAWIWEEAHVIGTHGSSFRPALLSASHVLPQGLRVLAFTATMPPVLLPMLQRHLLRPEDKFRSVIRSQAVQSHMVYEVRFVHNQTISDEFINQLHNVSTSFLTGKQRRRGIVYFPTVPDATKMAAKFIKDGAWCHSWAHVYVHHSQDSMTDADRENNMTAFKSDMGGGGNNAFVWLFATSGAGTGLDVEDIGAVIAYKYCYGVLDLIQYFGRCRQGVGVAGLGLIFTSPGALHEFGAKLAVEERRPLGGSDTHADKTARQTNHNTFHTLLRQTQNANHHCCIREFLGNANNGEGTGVRCPDVPSPGAYWCQGCLNKRAAEERLRNVGSLDVAGRLGYQSPPLQDVLLPPSKSACQSEPSSGLPPRRSAMLMPGGTSQATRSPQVSSQQFGLTATVSGQFLCGGKCAAIQGTSFYQPQPPYPPRPAAPAVGACYRTNVRSPSVYQQTQARSQPLIAGLPRSFPPALFGPPFQLPAAEQGASSYQPHPPYPPHPVPALRTSLEYPPALGYNPCSTPSLISPLINRRLSPVFHEPSQQPPSAFFPPVDYHALPGIPAQRTHLVAPASTPSGASTSTPSSGKQAPPRTAAFPEEEVLSVIENDLEDCCDESNYLKACPYCLALTKFPFGSESGGVEHNPSMDFQFFLRTCPQFRPGRVLSFLCHECLLVKTSPNHNQACMVRGYSNGLRNAVQQAASKANLAVCGSCQIKSGRNATSLSFHSGPKYAFGPKTLTTKREEDVLIASGRLAARAPACKLNDTHLFIRFSWTLYLHRWPLLEKIIGHRASFKEQFHTYRTQCPGDPDHHKGFLPYFYHWLHQDWYQGAAFNNAHVIFVLYTKYLDNGTLESPVGPHHHWYDRIQSLHK